MYVDWLNNPDINQYLELRFNHHTLSSLNTFFESVQDDPDQLMCDYIPRKEYSYREYKNWSHKYNTYDCRSWHYDWR